jgi:cell wall integrity and stress response component
MFHPSVDSNDCQSTSKEESSATSAAITPIISVFTTIGQVHTITVMPTATGSSQNDLSQKSSGGGLGTGGAVGLTIGLVALIAIISALAWFFLRRKRQQDAELNNVSRRGSTAGLGALGGPIPSRTMSENSRYVLGTDGRQVVETWEPGDGPGSRRSRLMPVDPRLDPFAPVYQRNGENKSRESVNTLRDDHDYSRRVVHQGPILRATNPDQEHE